MFVCLFVAGFFFFAIFVLELPRISTSARKNKLCSATLNAEKICESVTGRQHETGFALPSQAIALPVKVKCLTSEHNVVPLKAGPFESQFSPPTIFRPRTSHLLNDTKPISKITKIKE